MAYLADISDLESKVYWSGPEQMNPPPKEPIKLTDQDKHALAQFFDLLHKNGSRAKERGATWRNIVG